MEDEITPNEIWEEIDKFMGEMRQREGEFRTNDFAERYNMHVDTARATLIRLETQGFVKSRKPYYEVYWTWIKK